MTSKETRAWARQYARYTGETAEAALTGEFDNVYLNGQPRKHKTFTSNPSLDDLKDGDVVLTDVSGVRKIVVRIGGALYHVNLSSGA